VRTRIDADGARRCGGTTAMFICIRTAPLQETPDLDAAVDFIESGGRCILQQ
jgi:hypothetical protein